MGPHRPPLPKYVVAMPHRAFPGRPVLPAVALFSILAAGFAQAQTAVPDPMARPLPNPMAPLANPMMPMQTAPSGGAAPNPMAAPSAPNPMPRGGGMLNPMVPGAPAGGGEEVAIREDLGNLPDTPGVEDTYYLCTACHSAATFAQQRVTDARWDYLWDWMIERQGMPDYGPELRDVILGYLKTHFSSER